MDTAAASVLVITRDQDLTADLVIRALADRDQRVVRFDLADFPERLTEIAYLVPGRGRWTGALRGPHRDVDLSAVRAVLYRKPSRIRPHPQMTSTEQQWAAAEAGAGFGGLLTALPGVRWVNHPTRIVDADQKPRQLAVADQLGLTVPATLLTNDPDQARDFCRVHQLTGVITKALRGGPASENHQHVALWASPVTAEQITDSVRRTTHVFQARVPGVAVRMTVVGEQVFATRLDPATGGRRVEVVDWRQHDGLIHTPIDVPDDVATAARSMTARFGLRFAAPDFQIDTAGRWVFCGDLNPNGQWAWQTALRDRIAAALADELTTTPE